MKKIFQLGLILSSAFILSACGLQTNPGSDSSDSSSSNGLSLKDLLTQDASQKCTWVSEEEGQKTTAEIFVKGGKFKEIITSDNDTGKMTNYAINDGEYVYTWSPAQGGQEGYAMKTRANIGDTTNNEDMTEEDQTTDQIDLDAKHQLVCNPVDISDDEFTPPSDIKFVDYEEFLQQMQSSYPIDLSQATDQ